MADADALLPVAVVLVVVLAVVAGLCLVMATLLSAVRTVVVPRGERPLLTAAVFLTVRRLMEPALRRSSAQRREQLLRRCAPLSLMALAGTWGLLVIIGFVPLHWALGEISWIDALQVSGSSLTTLGFLSAEPAPARLVEIAQVFIGLGLVGLLISFLPAMYAAYSDREKLVAQMASRAGEPPTVARFLVRMQRIRGIDDPEPTDPVSVTREEFDECWDELAAAGVPLVADRDRAWRDWAGWRVNWDAALLGLAGLVEPPEAPWSSDRATPQRRRVLRQVVALRRAARTPFDDRARW